MSIHTPVLKEEVLKFLQVKPGRLFIDATVGEGGHAKDILDAGGEVLGIDQDPEILKRAKENLGDKATLVHGNFKNIDQIAKRNGFSKVNGVLMDLGLSSWQLEASNRGFTFQKDEPLDMRANTRLKVTAADLLNGLKKHELEKLFGKLGEEKQAGKLAEAIVRTRAVKPFSTTFDLVEVIEKVKGEKKNKIHPATNAFQALRIAVNGEREALRSALPRAVGVLAAGGRLVVISFQSLEDREVKDYFKKAQSEGLGQVLTKKPVTPSKQEIDKNPRSRSAKLRSFEKK